MTDQEYKFHQWFLKMYKEIQDLDDRELSEVNDMVRVQMIIRHKTSIEDFVRANKLQDEDSPHNKLEK